ncbi:hypothetical protein ACE6HX_11925 [Bacillus pumilus]|uniref:hypothetical protein n=1 Tax=Bacillus pumilus TaxID=1408 RepID=UPI0035CFA372
MTKIRVIESLTRNDFNLEDTTVYNAGTISDGYGRASGVVVEVTKGAVVDLNIDFEITMVSEAAFSAWKTSVYDYLTSEQKAYLEEHHRASGRASWLLAALGAVSAGGNYDHYRNKTDVFNIEGSAEKEGFLRSLYNLDLTKHKITGNIKVTGTSHIPSKVSVFIHLLNITFSDGKNIKVIDTDKAVAADPETKDTSKSEVAGTTLHELPTN